MLILTRPLDLIMFLITSLKKGLLDNNDCTNTIRAYCFTSVGYRRSVVSSAFVLLEVSIPLLINLVDLLVQDEVAVESSSCLRPPVAHWEVGSGSC